MVTKYEAQKLQHDMRAEMNASPAVVFKCAACLLVFVLLVLIGSADLPERNSVAGLGGDIPQRVTAVASAERSNAAMEHE